MPTTRSRGFKDVPGEKPLPKQTKLVRGSTASNTATKTTSTPKLNMSKTGTQRLRVSDPNRYGRMVARTMGADLSGVGAKQAAKSAAGKAVVKAVGKAAARAVPYVGTALLSADAGAMTGRAIKKATTKKISATNMASVNPRGMDASEVRSVIGKLKKRK